VSNRLRNELVRRCARELAPANASGRDAARSKGWTIVTTVPPYWPALAGSGSSKWLEIRGTVASSQTSLPNGSRLPRGGAALLARGDGRSIWS